jgi:hypothetical protein
MGMPKKKEPNEQRSIAPSNGSTDIRPLTAGLQAGLLGVLLTAIEVLARLAIPRPEGNVAVLFAVYRVSTWFATGAISVVLLREHGTTDRPQQKQAAFLASLLTGMAALLMMLVISVVKGGAPNTPVPQPGVSQETFMTLVALTALCCYGLPTMAVAMGVSYLGSLVVRLFLRPK